MKYLVEKKLADPERVGIYGWRYSLKSCIYSGACESESESDFIPWIQLWWLPLSYVLAACSRNILCRNLWWPCFHLGCLLYTLHGKTKASL